MRIMIFTEGTILMHKGGVGHTREEIIQQVKDRESSVQEYAAYLPIGNVARKIRQWASQGAEIVYLTSRRKKKEVHEIKKVLDRNRFPKGALTHRKWFERYKSIAERIMPDVLVEDYCESIGGEWQMTYPRINPKFQK